MKATPSSFNNKARAQSQLPATLKPLGYLEIAQELRRRIEDGQWKAGDKLPSYSESRVMFGAHSVALEKAHAQLEREGLIVREKGRGIFVARSTPHARCAARTATGLVGVAGLGFSFKEYSPYWVKLLRGIREVVDAAEHQIILLDHQSNKGWEKADGVLICDWSNHATLQFLPPQMPCVSVLVQAPNNPSVYADDYRGNYEATEHLLKLGHEKIAFMHTLDGQVGARRVEGWRDALLDAGIKPLASWEKVLRGRLHYGTQFVVRGRDTMTAWLESDWNQTGCSAIIAHNDETAVGIIQALQAANIRVPQDVSVVGYDGAQPREYSSPELTTVRVPLEEIGQSAAKLLMRQLSGEDAGNEDLLIPTLLEKGQSASRRSRHTL